MKGFSSTRYGNLVRHDSGAYYVRARVGGGREVVRSLNTKVETVARLRLAGKLAQMRAEAGRLRSGDLTLAECAAVYLHEKSKAIKPRAYEYRLETVNMVRRFWPDFDSTLSALVSETDCQQWADRAREHYGRTRFNGQVESLRGVLSVAVRSSCLKENPALRVARVKAKNDPADSGLIPTREQFTEILRGLDSHPKRRRAALAVRAMAFTGLRVNEARHLVASDVDLDAGTLLVRVTKNGRPRTIQMIPQAVELFSESKARVLEALRHSPRKALKTVCRALGFDRWMTPHGCRHVFGTRLIQSGVDIVSAAETLGHQDRGRTLVEVYAHPEAAHVRRMMKKVTV